MKLEIQARDDHQVHITVELPQDVQEKYFRISAKKISKNVRIPGFRPGKASYDVVKRHVGEKQIEDQAIDLMLDEFYPKAVEEADISPSGPGSLEEYPTFNPPIFKFIIPLEPVISLPDYRSIRKEYSPEEVTDEHLNRVINRLQLENATTTSIEDKPTKENDRVHLSLSANFTEPEEEDDEDIVTDQTLQIVISEKSQEEGAWPYPEFYKELIGLSIDEEKTVVHQYGEDDTPYDKLQSKEVTFSFQVQSIHELELPELDDEFATTVDEEYETFEDLKNAIKGQLEYANAEEYEKKYLEDLITDIVKDAEVEYPPQMLEEEMKSSLDSIKRNLAGQNLDLEAYLSIINMDEKTFTEVEVRPSAIENLERSLVLQKLIESEEIKVSPEELQMEVSRTLQMFGNMQGDRKLPKGTTAQDVAQAATYDSANRIMSERLMARIKSIASGEFEKEQALEQEKMDKENAEQNVDSPETVNVEAVVETESPNDAIEEPAETTDSAVVPATEDTTVSEAEDSTPSVEEKTDPIEDNISAETDTVVEDEIEN